MHHSLCPGRLVLNSKIVAFLTSWSWTPSVLVPIVIAAVLYGFGWWRLRHRGRGRSAPPAWRVLYFGMGLGCIWLALLSPIDAYSGLLFSMHMIEHLILIVVAAPLLLLGAPLLPMLWALPAGVRREVGLLIAPRSPLHWLGHNITRFGTAVAVYVIMIAVWHLPPFYDAAEGYTLTHYLEHLSFLVAALVFWWPVIHPSGGRRRLSYLSAVPYFIPAVVEGSLIGIIQTFAGSPIYSYYTRVPRVWPLSVMDDQKLGGLIMWILGGAIYLLPILIVFTMYLNGADERQPQRAMEVAENPRVEDA